MNAPMRAINRTLLACRTPYTTPNVFVFVPTLCYIVQESHHKMSYAVHSQIKNSAAANTKRHAMTFFMCRIHQLRSISPFPNQLQKNTHVLKVHLDTPFNPFMAIHTVVVIVVLVGRRISLKDCFTVGWSLAWGAVNPSFFSILSCYNIHINRLAPA